MAEAMMKQMIAERGLSDRFLIDSAAVSREETGNPMYPPAVRKQRKKGIDPGSHRARTLVREDYERFDYLIAMDDSNIRYMMRILGSDPEYKIHKMMEFAGSSRSVADPWYTGDFETTYQDLEEGITGLIEQLTD